MKFPFGQRFLVVYSGVLTLVFAATVLLGAKSATHAATFDELTVHRINVVEPDGTLRMVLSNAASSPGTPYHGKEIPRPDRKVAGLVFVNDEGTENGGLIWGGRKDKDGEVSSHGHLSFDSYDQDQSLVIQASQDDTTRKSTYIAMVDRPYWDIQELFKVDEASRGLPDAQRRAAFDTFMQSHARSEQRVFLGTRTDRASALLLSDAEGRTRIRAVVAPDGAPSLEFLDEGGKVIQKFPQPSTP